MPSFLLLNLSCACFLGYLQNSTLQAQQVEVVVKALWIKEDSQRGPK